MIKIFYHLSIDFDKIFEILIGGPLKIDNE